MVFFRGPVRYVLGTAMVLGILFLAVGGPRLTRRLGAYVGPARRLPELRRIAQSEGLLITGDALNHQSRIPAEQNAAPLYQEIANKLPFKALSGAENDSLNAVINGTASPAQIAQARKTLAKHTAKLTLAAAAAKLPDCRFHRDYTLGPDMLLPEYPGIRTLVRLLAARAVLESDNPRAALSTVAVIARIAGHMEKDPVLIGDLVGIALESIADHAWRAIVIRNAARPEVLQMAAETDKVFPPPPNYRQAIADMVLTGQIAIDHVRHNVPTGIEGLDTYARSAPHLAVVADAWEARHLDYWIRVDGALKAHPNDYVAANRALEAVRAIDKPAAEKHLPSYELQDILAFAIETTPLIYARIQAEHAERVALLGLLAFKNRTGSFPVSLADLRPAPPIDPFSGAPLHYRRQGAGFILYSVGENLKDDGGDVTHQDHTAPRDLGFRYP